jgi:NADH:ubiquinone oxidoreductase subunit 6 (subunit J)
MRSSEAYAIASLAILFAVMVASFVGLPWPSEQNELPVTGDGSVSQALFASYPFTIVLIALVLSVAMIGGAYLSKREGGRSP